MQNRNGRYRNLVFTLAVGLAACGGGADNPTPGNDAGHGVDADPAEEDAIGKKACDLELTKTVEGDTSPGGSATYTLAVDNVGTAACAPPIQVSDDLPPGVSFQSSPSSNWNCSTNSAQPATVECTYTQNALAPNDSLELQLEVDIGDRACMSSNCAEVANGKRPGQGAQSPRLDNNPDNNRDCEDSQCKNSSGCVDPPSDMVGWWTGDQTADDRSVEGNDGSLQNGAHFATGQVLESFEFDGTDDHVKVPDDNSLDFDANQNFSVDFWVHPSSKRDVGYIMDKREELAAGITGWGLYWKSGQLNIYLHTNAPNSNAPNVTYSSGSGAVPAGEWTHVTMVVDRANDSGTLYIDGATEGTFTPSSTASGTLANGAPLYFGRNFAGEKKYHFKGRLDEVEIFDRTLTAGEIAGLVRAGPCGKCRIPCEETTKTYTAGKDDAYADGTEPASPSPYLQQNYGPLKPFDATAINRHVGHTFTDLKPSIALRNICRATLVVEMKPGNSTLSDNDGIRLTFSDGTGTKVGPDWHSRLGGPNGIASNAWSQSNYSTRTFTLDLSSLPNSNGGPTDLLAALDNYAMLNVRVQDDTVVDHMKLKVKYCCDDDQTGGDESPDLAIRKSHEGDLTVGQPSAYTISVDNVGNGEAAPPTEITDEVPGCMEIQGIAPPWDAWCNVGSNNQVTCSYPDPIPAGGSLPDIELRVVPSADCGDKVENCAEVSNAGDANGSNDESCDGSVVSQEERRADISVEKSHSGAITLGAINTYDITVANDGPADAQGPITVTDDLPDCLQFGSASPSTWSCSVAGNGTLTCTHPGPLASGDSLSLELTVRPTDTCGDRVRNCAKAQAASPADPDLSNNNSCDTSTVQ